MNIIFRLFFPSIAKRIDHCENTKKANSRLRDKVNHYEKELNDLKEKYISISKALKDNKDKIFSFEKTHKNAEIIIQYYFFYLMFKSSIDIRVWGIKNYNSCNQDLLLYAYFSDDNETVVIENITGPREVNLGYGESAIKKLIDISKEKGFKKIIGNLEYVDINDHKDRLFHFYNKLGFETQINTSGNKGKIYLEI